MSSENACEKQAHRKSKVSWGRLIRPGLVEPKLRPYGVSDGRSVNIQIPAKWRFPLCGKYFLYDARCVKCGAVLDVCVLVRVTG